MLDRLRQGRDRLIAITVPGGDMRMIMGGASTTMAIRAAGAILAYLSQVLLARWMGSFEFGIYSYCWALVSVLALLAPLGLSNAIARFVPEYRVKEDWRRAAGVIRGSQLITVACAIVLAGLCALVVTLGRDHIADHYIVPLYVAFACIPFFALLQLLSETIRTFGWVMLAFAPLYVVRPALLLVGAGALALAGHMLSGTAVLAVALVSCCVTALPQAVMLFRRLPEAIRDASAVYDAPYWLRIAFPMLLAQGFYFLLAYTDVMMLGAFVPPTEIGVYNAAARTAGLLAFITYAVSVLATPRFAALHAEGKPAELQSLAISVAHWVFWPSLAAGTFLVAAGQLVLGLFGPLFTTGYAALVVLVLGHVAAAGSGGVGNLLNMTGHQGATAIALSIAAALNVALNLALIPAFGILGAGIATAISFVVLTLALIWIARRRLGYYVLVFAPRQVRD